MINHMRTLLKPHLLVMFVLFAGAAAAGHMLLPGAAERVAMLERDGDNGRALALLEHQFASGDRSQQTLYQMEQLYQFFGDLAKARVMLEQLAHSRPRDQVLQRRLVKFYRDTQDSEAYLDALSRLVSRRYSEPACRELISQLRLLGQYAREREAIERCRVRGYRLEGDILRLAELEAVTGDKPKATALLRNVDDIKGLHAPRERLLLTSLLLDAHAGKEVGRRAVKWLGRENDDTFSEALMAYLGSRNAHDTAIAIARAAGKPGEALSLSVAELMLDRDQTSAARAYLRGWIESAEIKDQNLASRFIDDALDAEDPELALLAARRFGMQKLPENDLVKIAEALGATGRRDDFEVVHAALSHETLVAHPLLSAMVELNRGATDTTRNILGNVSSEALDTWRLALWARLMRETGRGADADARLRAGAAKNPDSIRPTVSTARRVSQRQPRLTHRQATRLRAAARRATVRSRVAGARRKNIENARLSRSRSKQLRRVNPRGRNPNQPYLTRPQAVTRPVAQNSGAQP
ncbi:MAG: hypothetical protein KDJ47_08845 [Hyphomicrobiaceae bacterium]|nr:hypothetical protein [Hyphomicrobiaceae bacterium]